jgi:pyrimidine-specific ribonucleoside hydrolase
MYGLDVFMRPGITSEEALRLKNSTAPAAKFAGTLVDAFIERLHISPITLGDYGAVAMAIHPELFTTEMFDVVVDTSSGPARGQTICDRRDAFLKDLEPLGLEDSAKVRVVMDLDVEAVRQLWLKTIDKEWS